MRKAHTPGLRRIMVLLQKAVLTHLKNSGNTVMPPERFSPERRRFSKDLMTLGLAAGVLPGITFSSCNISSGKKKEDVKVVIVGGGMAGLRCGYELKKENIPFEIYEADKRTGGRILTKQETFGKGLWTEFGGEFIDSDHEDMLYLLEEFQLEKMDTFTDTALREVVFIKGNSYNEEEVFEQFTLIAPRIAQDLQYCGPDFDTQEAKILDNLTLEYYIRNLECEAWFQDMLIAAYVGEYGLDASEQSALNLIDLINTDVTQGFKIFGNSDERYKVIGGNQRIVDALAGKLADEIKLNRQLTAIRQSGDRYILTFNNSIEVIADKVVLAIPFTILRKVDMSGIEMEPMKRKCINELGYGQNSKLLVGFDKRVWREETPSKAGFLTNEEIHTGWDNSQMQNNNEGPAGYTVFLGGNPSLEMCKEARSHNMKNKVPEEWVEKYLNILEEVFPGMKQEYNRENQAALWPNNPYSLGSYACCRPGQYATLVTYAAQPVGEIYFAGEHCSLKYLGFMNGAAETGRIAAESIIASLKAALSI